ncbi:uncharacterized protein LOC110382250 [Helicoverpa armigera]|uniref:uncharacterized protein LOC110382250 n=1 Tax=Helicoverpa armigera TaxID=29058 RepID=UPI0021130F00|nr:uncharacterized protein LOC110382250 [Helicoverpa armigera]
MKFLVLTILALAWLEGFYCAPFLEFLIPKSSNLSYRGGWSAEVPDLARVGGNHEFDWNTEWEKPMQRPRLRRPPPRQDPDSENYYPNYPTYPGNYPNNYPQYQAEIY